MNEELKAILAKPEGDRTKNEESKIKEAVAAFQAEIVEVCRKHGLQYQATAGLTVMVMAEEKETVKGEEVEAVTK